MSKKMSKKYAEWQKRQKLIALRENLFFKKFGPVVISSKSKSLKRINSLSRLSDYNLAFYPFMDKKFVSVPLALSSLHSRGLTVPKPYRSFVVRSNADVLDRLPSEKTIRGQMAENALAFNALESFRYLIEDGLLTGAISPVVNESYFLVESSMAQTYDADYALCYPVIDSPSPGGSVTPVLDHTWFKIDVMNSWMKRLETDFGYSEFVSTATNPWMRPERVSSYFSRKSFDPLGSYECTDLYDQVLSQYNGHTANVGMTLGEGKETIDYLKSRVASLVDLVSNVKKGKPLFSLDKIKKLRAKHVVDKLTDAQLEYQYAILPLMADIENYISLYHRKIVPKCQGFKKYSTEYNIVIPSASNKLFHNIYGANPNATCSLEEWQAFASAPPAVVTAGSVSTEGTNGLLTSENVSKFSELDASGTWAGFSEANNYLWDGAQSRPWAHFYILQPSPVVNMHCTETLKKSLTFYPEISLELKNSLGLNGKDLPSLAWDLTSLSFVVNWFINVDEVISGFADKVADLKGCWVESYHLERVYTYQNGENQRAIRVTASDRHVQEKCSVQGQYALSLPSSWSQFVSLFSLAWKTIS